MRSMWEKLNFGINFHFSGFPTLILLVHTISPEIFPSSVFGKLFEEAWRKNWVKRLLHWLAILDCDSILGLLQSCELLAVGCPRLWVPRSHWSIASSPIGRQQLRLDSLELKFHWSQISPSGSGFASGPGFGPVFAALNRIVLFLYSHPRSNDNGLCKFYGIKPQSKLIRYFLINLFGIFSKEKKKKSM